MRQRYAGLLMLLTAFAVCFSARAAEDKPAKPVLTIAADEWCPINCDPKSDRPGIGIELARAVFEPLGYRVNYVVMPWTKALEQVRAGKVDAVVGASRTDDPSLVFPVSTLYPISDDFYVLVGNPWRYQGVASLSRQRVGVIESYGYGGVVRKFIEDNKNVNGAVFVASGEDALKDNINKLMAGKIDVLIENRPVMEYTLRKLGIEDKITWTGGLSQGSVYLAFSPALPESKTRMQQLDAGYIRLRNSGALDAMYKPYGLKLP